ncbi:MAG: hypothetical protein CMQ05_09880 [Gammaproteobacteria bacterium]|nr:hypothetical protein [Gammaproteobacteria bacterium]RPG26861.1 MAG: hypothetical protein CBC10_003060 [Gammaproteobacteria bacterium TMED50]|tara:strand:- start:2025 stop:2225 length:201 start_codon:yes stop_codon:yes gene_type:complete
MINIHDAYGSLRDVRIRARAANIELRGSELAAGLLRYSERGQEYIDEVRAMIRINKLDQYDLVRNL